MNDSINQGCAGGDSIIIVITTKNECCTLLEIYKPISFILYYLCIAYTEGQKNYNIRTKNQGKKSLRITILTIQFKYVSCKGAN